MIAMANTNISFMLLGMTSRQIVCIDIRISINLIKFLLG